MPKTGVCIFHTSCSWDKKTGGRTLPNIGFCLSFFVQTQYTILFSHNDKYWSETFPYQRSDFLVHLHLHSRLRRIQWRILIFVVKIVTFEMLPISGLKMPINQRACSRLCRFILNTENVTQHISDIAQKLIVYTLRSIWSYSYFLENDINKRYI